MYCRIQEYLNYIQEEYEVSIIGSETKKLKNNIPPEKRTLNNLPRYSNKKPKVRFQDWLMLKMKNGVGQAKDNSWYGWSHRAINSYKIGDNIKPDDMGSNSKESYKIKTDEEAMNHAIKFSKAVS